MPGGRPSLYQKGFAAQAAKLSKLGATNADLAEFFEVTTRTVDNWIAQKPEFFRALKISRKEANERVERSLYQRAVGYRQEAVKIFMPAGASEPVYATYTEVIAPETTACIFWLKNRDPENWRDRQEFTGANGGPIAYRWAEAA